MHGTMAQGLLKRFDVLKKCRNKFECLVFEFKAKSQRAIRLHSCESIFIIFAPSYVNSSRQNRFKCCNLHDLSYIFLDNGVMNTPKRRFLSFPFTVLCINDRVAQSIKFKLTASKPVSIGTIKHLVSATNIINFYLDQA